jgi:two-component system response regulator
MKTILLVEDNPDDVLLTKRAFEKSHVLNSVVVAEDGEQALEFLFGLGENKDNPLIPELILLDLKMPKVGGLEVLERLQQDPVLSLIPVVVLTTSTEEEDLVKSYKYGANSFIRKPVDFNQFVAAVKQLELYWMVLNKGPHNGNG